MDERVKDRAARAIGSAGQGVLSAAAGSTALSLPVRYQSQGVWIECMIPRWSELFQVMDVPREVTLIIVQDAVLRWVHLRGQADVVIEPDWTGWAAVSAGSVRPSDLFQVLRLRPNRIELFDEVAGWGHRETLDL